MKKVKNQDVPDDMKKCADTGECNENFHSIAGTAKPGDKCKCGKTRFLEELLDRGLN